MFKPTKQSKPFRSSPLMAPIAAISCLVAASIAFVPESEAKGAKTTKKAKPAVAAASELVGPPWPMKYKEAPKSVDRMVFSSAIGMQQPLISITFDDGPHPVHTPRLLGILKERGIKATFFVLGQCVQRYPEIAKQIVADGHEIASHSWSHPILSQMGEPKVFDELDHTQQIIRDTLNLPVTLMRPPFGALTLPQRKWVSRTWNHKIILWDVDSHDWQTRNAQKTEETILKNTKPGSIILCHDIHRPTIDAMPTTLDGLLARGFKFATVSELLSAPTTAEPSAAPAVNTLPGNLPPTTTPAVISTPPAIENKPNLER